MNSQFVFKKFKTSDHHLYVQSVAWRQKILRAPLGKCFSADDLAIEKNNQFYALLFNGKVIATLSTYEKSENLIRLVSFAVDSTFQYQGVGSSLLKQMLNDIKNCEYNKISLTARESALGFYLKNGFEDISGPFANKVLGIIDYEMVLCLT